MTPRVCTRVCVCGGGGVRACRLVVMCVCVSVCAGSLSRTNRTPRQQLQNKQAQQRYRERRKMKVTEMEQALAAMSQQVDELQGVMKQNVALQVRAPHLHPPVRSSPFIHTLSISMPMCA